MLNRLFIYFFSIMLLSACGGGGGDDGNDNNTVEPSPPVVNTAIYAGDTMHVFKAKSATTAAFDAGSGTVELAPFVVSSDDSEFLLDNIERLSGDESICDDVTIHRNSFSVSADEVSNCVYRYTVSTASGAKGSGISRVSFATNISRNQLEPLSFTIGENETGEILIPTTNDHTLSAVVTVLGSGTASANPVERLIQYHSAEAGISRILYTMSSADGHSVYMGTIDVAVSSSANQPPVAKNFVLSLDQTGSVIRPGAEVIIDVAKHISDPDGDVLQIHDLQSFNGVAWIDEKADVENTRIKFKSYLPGDFYVSYTVTDHLGGFATGLIQVKVVNFYSDFIAPMTGDFFLAPKTAEQASLFGVQMVPLENPSVKGSDSVFRAAGFTYDGAVAMCALLNSRLPTQSEFFMMRVTGIPNNWPSDHQYWLDNRTSSDIGNSIVDTPSLFKPLLVTCIGRPKIGDFTIDINVERSMKTNAPYPVSFYYSTEGGEKIKYKGDVSFSISPTQSGTNNSVLFERLDMDGNYLYTTNNASGPFILSFTFRDINSPLFNMTVNMPIYVYERVVAGFFGTMVDDSGKVLPGVKAFDYTNSESIYCRGGFIVDAIGHSFNNKVGGNGGSLERIITAPYPGTNKTYLDVQTVDYKDKKPKTTIGKINLKFMNSTGSDLHWIATGKYNKCGENITTNYYDFVSNIRTTRVEIPSASRVISLTVYSDKKIGDSSGFINGVSIITESTLL